MNFSSSNNELNYNDRKRILFMHFEKALPNKEEFSIEELFLFLDQKSGKKFNRNLGKQIYEITKDKNEKINLADFISQYLETEDTINFRIDLEKKKIEDLIERKENILLEKKNFIKKNEEKKDFENMNTKLTITIKEAMNIEPATTMNVNSYVSIEYDSNKYKTEVIYDNRNPVWNEEFILTMKKNIRNIFIHVIDNENYEVLGHLNIDFKDIEKKKNEDRVEYLMRNDGLKTRSKLSYSLDIQASKIDLLEEEIQKIDSEIKEIDLVVKQNQKVILELKEPFFENTTREEITFQSNNNNIVQIYDEENNVKKNNMSNYFEITPFEEKLSAIIDNFLLNKGIENWNKIIFYSYSIFIIMAMLISFLKCNYFDFMIIFFLIYQARANPQKINFLFLRIILGLLIFSTLLDILWLIFYTEHWKDGYDNSMNGLKTFVIVFCYLQFFYKFLLGFIFWKNSITPDTLKETLRICGI